MIGARGISPSLISIDARTARPPARRASPTRTMSSQPRHSAGTPGHYSRSLLLLLATIAGVSVANIYYNQPLLDAFRASFPGSASWIGVVPTATQLGYATGMLVLAPLGDRFDRRTLILLQIAGLSAELVVAAAPAPRRVLGPGSRPRRRRGTAARRRAAARARARADS